MRLNSANVFTGRAAAYGYVCGLLGLLCLARVGLAQRDLVTGVPFSLYTFVVAFGAFLGGWGPGLFACAMSVPLVMFYLHTTGTTSEPISYIMFEVQALMICGLGASLHSTLRRLHELNSQLEARVAERTGQLQGANAELHRALQREQTLRADIERSNAQLSVSNRELEEFATVASHDLQEPLRKIQAFGDRLERRLREAADPAVTDELGRIRSAAQRLQNLVNDLLAFSRAGSQAKAAVAVDLTKLVGAVWEDYELQVNRKNARLHLQELPVMRGDPGLMRQLVQNLISNALKFQQEGVPPEVTVAAQVPQNGDRRPDGNWTLSVQDNGIGFDEKYQEKIFQVFQRLHSREEFEGTGVGLALCRKIASRHRGAITAHSSPGAGTRFDVTFPLDTLETNA